MVAAASAALPGLRHASRVGDAQDHNASYVHAFQGCRLSSRSRVPLPKSAGISCLAFRDASPHGLLQKACL